MSTFLIEETKYAEETFPLSRDFTNSLPTGTTISSATVAIENYLTGEDVTGTIAVSPTATVSGAIVTIRLQAGNSGEKFLVTMTMTLSDSSVILHRFILRIKSKKSPL